MSGLLLKYLHLTTDENNTLPPGDAKRACSIIAIPPLHEVHFDGYNLIEVLDDGKVVFKTQITGNAYLMTEAGKTINTFTPSVFERANLVELHDTHFLKLNSTMKKLKQWSELDALNGEVDNEPKFSLRPAGDSMIEPAFFKYLYAHFSQIRFHIQERIYNLGEQVTVNCEEKRSFKINASTLPQLLKANGLESFMDPLTKISYPVLNITCPRAIDQGSLKDFVTGPHDEPGCHFNFILNEGRHVLNLPDDFMFPGVNLKNSSVKIITDSEDKILTFSKFSNLVNNNDITKDYEYYVTEGGMTKIHALLFRTYSV